MEQVRKAKQNKATEETPVEEVVPPGAADLSETDDLIAEIDALLEENAEEFVAQFIQKGGQ